MLTLLVAHGAGEPHRTKPDRLLFVDETYAARDHMPPLMRAGLEKAGWKNMSFVQWNDLSPGLLRQARAVVIVSLPCRLDVTDEDYAIADLLTDYVKQGGGLLLTQSASQMPAAELAIFNLLARRFGTRILLEDVQSDPGTTEDHRPVGRGRRVHVYRSRLRAGQRGRQGRLLPVGRQLVGSLRRAALRAGLAVARGAFGGAELPQHCQSHRFGGGRQGDAACRF